MERKSTGPRRGPKGKSLKGGPKQAPNSRQPTSKLAGKTRKGGVSKARPERRGPDGRGAPDLVVSIVNDRAVKRTAPNGKVYTTIKGASSHPGKPFEIPRSRGHQQGLATRRPVPVGRPTSSVRVRKP